MFLLFLLLVPPAGCQENIRFLTFYQAVLNNSSLPKYDKRESPYDVYHEKVDIQVEVGFVILTKVVEVQQLVSYIANVVFGWQDKRLAFDPELLGFNATVIPSSSIWIPTLDCFNCVGVKKFDKETDSNEALVQSNGVVAISLKASFDTVCNTHLGLFLSLFQQNQLESFPFDTQYCGIDFSGGYSSAISNSQVYIGNETAALNTLLGTPEWNIYRDEEDYNETNPEVFVTIRFRLDRNSTFYVVLLILPTLIVCTVCLSALTLPLDFTKSARFTMAASGLVALTFLLGIIIQQVPRSKSVPILGRWVLMEEFMVFLALMIDEPIKFLKRKLCEKRAISHELICFIKFGIIVGTNILATILIFTVRPKPIKEFYL